MTNPNSQTRPIPQSTPIQTSQTTQTTQDIKNTETQALNISLTPLKLLSDSSAT
jgi:hypothetical protein